MTALTALCLLRTGVSCRPGSLPLWLICAICAVVEKEGLFSTKEIIELQAGLTAFLSHVWLARQFCLLVTSSFQNFAGVCTCQDSDVDQASPTATVLYDVTDAVSQQARVARYKLRFSS